mmetsp:Transcript_4011/g.10843  ORF Transcript_4011/g.10843 Transcript_4011/m.10843 type:complete len:357 (+) Transcript_4011:789-1859(+)
MLSLVRSACARAPFKSPLAHARPVRPAVVDTHVTRSLCPVAICNSRESSTESTRRPWSQCPQESKILPPAIVAKCCEPTRASAAKGATRRLTVTESPHSTPYPVAYWSPPACAPVMCSLTSLMRSAADPMACVMAPPESRPVVGSIFGLTNLCTPTERSAEAVTTRAPAGNPGTFVDFPKLNSSSPSTQMKAMGDAAFVLSGRYLGGATTAVSATECGECRMGGSGDGGGARLGCGFRKSCAGVWPKLTICDSAAALASGSSTASRSTEPSYVSGWKTLWRRTLSSPRCAWPKTRSIHRCIRADTVSDSSASRMSRMNSCGELLAQGGKATSPTAVPCCVAPRSKPLELARNSGRE